jgi:hypothetical protein
MVRLRTLLLLSIVALSGCANLSAHRQGHDYSSSYCREGSQMICNKDSLRGCGCGNLVVL